MSCYWGKIVNKLKSGSAELRHDIIYNDNNEYQKKKKKNLNEKSHMSTYGATGKSAFLFLMGSDMTTDGFKEKNQK